MSDSVRVSSCSAIYDDPSSANNAELCVDRLLVFLDSWRCSEVYLQEEDTHTHRKWEMEGDEFGGGMISLGSQMIRAHERLDLDPTRCSFSFSFDIVFEIGRAHV